MDIGMKREKRIYLDVCCLNRPFDDQDQERVRMETEAVKSILSLVGGHEYVAVGSDAIDFEIGRLSDPDQYLELVAIVDGFGKHVKIEEPERGRGKALESFGFGPMDALHLACSEKAGAVVMLTTDDDLLKKAIRHAAQLRVRVANPLVWLAEVLRK